MIARLLADSEVPWQGRTSRVSGSRWLVATEVDIRVLGPRLEPQAIFVLPEPMCGIPAVGPDGSFIVVCTAKEVLRIERTGRVTWATSHPPWSTPLGAAATCWLPADGTVAGVTVTADDGTGEWWMLDAATGERFDALSFGCALEVADLRAHPDGHHVGIDVDDGTRHRLFWGRWAGRVATLTPADNVGDRMLVDVRPDGSAYLTVAHDLGDLTAHRFATGIVVGRQEPSPSWGVGVGFDALAGYVRADLVLAGSQASETHEALTAESLRFVDLVGYPDELPHGQIRAGWDGTWLTVEPGPGPQRLLELWTTA
jgi:hypothetical protein